MFQKIHDISQEFFTARVYPGDTAPRHRPVAATSAGDVCNVAAIEMNDHNGTHIDAPWHFLDGGKKIDEIALEKCVGPAVVISIDGDVTENDIDAIFQGNGENPAFARILFKGDASLGIDAARRLNHYGVKLVGCESQSVAPVSAPAPVHIELLGHEVVILEGLSLDGVADGEYFLCAAPLPFGGLSGAPCRALLLE